MTTSFTFGNRYSDAAINHNRQDPRCLALDAGFSDSKILYSCEKLWYQMPRRWLNDADEVCYASNFTPQQSSTTILWVSVVGCQQRAASRHDGTTAQHMLACISFAWSWRTAVWQKFSHPASSARKSKSCRRIFIIVSY